MITTRNINTWNTIPLQMTSIMSRYTYTKTISNSVGVDFNKNKKTTLYVNL